MVMWKKLFLQTWMPTTYIFKDTAQSTIHMMVTIATSLFDTTLSENLLTFCKGGSTNHASSKVHI